MTSGGQAPEAQGQLVFPGRLNSSPRLEAFRVVCYYLLNSNNQCISSNFLILQVLSLKQCSVFLICIQGSITTGKKKKTLIGGSQKKASWFNTFEKAAYEILFWRLNGAHFVYCSRLQGAPWLNNLKLRRKKKKPVELDLTQHFANSLVHNTHLFFPHCRCKPPTQNHCLLPRGLIMDESLKPFGPQQPHLWVSLVAQLVKNLPAMQETLVQFLGREVALEKGQATHSSILGLPWWLK